MTFSTSASLAPPPEPVFVDGSPTGLVQPEARNEITGHDRVYLDYAATTPLDPAVVEAMTTFLQTDDSFGNPASKHVYGQIATDMIEHARTEVASLLATRPDEIIWTSGATEAINLGIKGVALARQRQGRHIVTSPLEHRAVLDTIDWLATQGFEISYVKPNGSGAITPTCLAEVIRPDTVLVSLMHVNNETGTITDIEALAPVLCGHPTLLHIDAVQTVARLPIEDISAADLISISAHKMYGPKGVGALRVRHPLLRELVPQIHGGGHELGLRSGTLATHQIVGMGCAATTVRQRLCLDAIHTHELDCRLREHLACLDGVEINGNPHCRVPGILNVAFTGIAADSLLLALDHMAISTGSACTSRAFGSSHVLTALGYPESRALSSVRFSFGRFTTLSDIDHIGNLLRETVPTLRRLAQ